MHPRHLLPLVALALLPIIALPQQTRPDTPPALYLGAAWYPEQWPEARWDADLTLMEQAHIRFARIGEFAWSSMEPTEGAYTWTWLDHAIEAAARHHIAIVLGTPSATPPAWLTRKYPETLRFESTASAPSTAIASRAAYLP